MATPFVTIRTEDKDLQRVQDNVKQALNRLENALPTASADAAAASATAAAASASAAASSATSAAASASTAASAVSTHEADTTNVHGITDTTLLVITNGMQTLSAKTFADAVTLAEVATPATPASGYTKVYPKSDGRLYVLDDAGNETQVGSGSGSGSGGINYISANTDAESNTSGWATYADAAGASPVDGTGGSANITFTRTTSSPLRGTGSFLITKDAANRQGEGVSYAFTIDRADATAGTGPKVQQITADYEIASGTYGYGTSSTDSDLTCYIYDVTNSQVIQPSGYKFDGGIFRATFQPNSTSTSYRLCFHIATTSASAWTLKLDNVKCGPQVASLGPAIGDWETITGLSGTWVANTTYAGKRRRVGDSEEYEIYVTTTGAPTAATLDITLPNRTIDTAKLATSDIDIGTIGTGMIEDVGTASYACGVVVSSNTQVRPYTWASSGAWVNNGIVNASSPMTWANGDGLKLKFSVPIAGWSSNTLVSDSADTRVVLFKGTKGSSQAVTANTTNITFPTTVKDTHGGWNGSDTYTVKVPGDYLVYGFLYPSVTGATSIQVYVNGVAGNWLLYAPLNLGGGGSVSVPNLKVGDTITVRSLNSVTIAGDSAQSLNISLIQGPSQIAASEVIAASYYGTTTAVATATLSVVPMLTRLVDTHGAYSTSTGKFTCPAPGVYRVSGRVTWADSSGVISRAVELVKNSTSIAGANWDNASASASTKTLGASTLVSAVAGDTFDIRFYQTTGGNITPSNDIKTGFEVERIGGVM